MDLFLIQHGAAKSKAEDPSRPLTPAGAEAVEKTAAWAASAGLAVKEIRHSGKRRAKETADIFARRLDPTGGCVIASGLDPADDVQPVAEALGRADGSVMVVGHLPFLGRLTGLLVAGDPEIPVVRFANAGIVCLARHSGRWSVAWAVTPELVY